MIKIKNVQPGIVIIADAGLKLTPGEVAEMETLTPQAKKAVDDGLLAQVEDDKRKAKSPDKGEEQTSDSKSQADLKSNTQAAKPDAGAKNGAG